MIELTHLSLENFRLFKEKTSFDLTPITIFTGANNSGKSSVIKAILLLKNNFEKNKSIEEIDFSIGDHNLNDFKNSLNYDSENEMMYFTFSSYVESLGVNHIELGYKLDRTNSSKGNLGSLTIYSQKGEIALSVSKGFNDKIGPNLTYKIDVKYFIKNLDHEVLNTNIKKEIFDDPYENWVQKYWLHSNDELITFEPNSYISKAYFDSLNILKNTGITTQSENPYVKNQFFNQSISDGIRNIGKEVMNWLKVYVSHKKIKIRKTDFGNFLEDDFSKWILNNTISHIINNFDAITHFSSIRSDSKKFYFKGENSLSSFFIHYKKFSLNFNNEIKEFIELQLREFSIGTSIEIDTYKDFLAEVFVIKDGKKIILSDLGYGYTQLLPIIMRIALTAHIRETDNSILFPLLDEKPFEPSYSTNLFLLEEPEGNLHPSFQTKIADLIVEANKRFKIQFIIETHSEYLIRKLQYLTATNKLDADDTSILYFHQKETKDYLESPYRSIRILENGRLSMPFGEGFYDEADRIAFELYRLKLNDN